MLRAVVDTNIWVSAFVTPSGRPGDVGRALRAGEFTHITSEPMPEELADVLSRPRITRRYSIAPHDGSEFVFQIRERSEIVTVSGSVSICRDPDDDIVIETALVGSASVIVTRDDDLKFAREVASFLASAEVEVLSVQRFLDLLDT